MSNRTYWLDLFTGATWEEFLAAGGKVSGFRETRWSAVQKIKTGDYFLCYITGISRFIGALEVTSAPYKDDSPIRKDEDFPSRVKVKGFVTLTPGTAVPVFELRDRLSFFQDMGVLSLQRCTAPSLALPLANQPFLSPLCFHILTNCFSCNPFLFTLICVAPGVTSLCGNFVALASFGDFHDPFAF